MCRVPEAAVGESKREGEEGKVVANGRVWRSKQVGGGGGGGG